MLLLYPALSILSALIVRRMIRIGALDHPGARSSHTVPTPKGGGVGIVVAFVVGLVTLCVVAPMPGWAFAGLLAAALGIAAVSHTDDVRSWSFKVKLGAQLAAALVAIFCGIRLRVVHLPGLGAIDVGWPGVVLTAAWMVFATNAVNFIDGLNGLASGSVAIACLFLAGIASSQGDWFVQACALVLAAGIAGFLPFNFPRARIFMGDVGSQFLGFVLAVLGVLAAGLGAHTLSVLLVPMMLAGVLFDVAFTLVRRLLAGAAITQAHRGHLYQVANRAGMTVPAVTTVYWAMAGWGGVCGVVFAARPGDWPWLAGCILVPQLMWLGCVAWLARRARLTTW